eukprot:ctg_178.g137
MERRKAGLDEALFDSAQRSVSADVYVRLFARQLHGALRPVPQESSKDGNRTMTWRRDCALWLVPLTWVCEVRRVREQRPGQTFKRPRRRVLWQRRIDKVELCGVVRELQTKWNFREWMIDDGTGVACAQEWWRGPAATGVNSSASAELEASRTESPGAAHSLAEVGSLVWIRYRRATVPRGPVTNGDGGARPSPSNADASVSPVAFGTNAGRIRCPSTGRAALDCLATASAARAVASGAPAAPILAGRECAWRLAHRMPSAGGRGISRGGPPGHLSPVRARRTCGRGGLAIPAKAAALDPLARHRRHRNPMPLLAGYILRSAPAIRTDTRARGRRPPLPCPSNRAFTQRPRSVWARGRRAARPTISPT